MKNYITKKGFEKLRAELSHLLNKERPQVLEVVSWAASNGDRSENADYQYGKRRLREIDSRIRYLTKKIEAAEVIEPEKLSSEKVLFGATVKILFESGKEECFQIVGEDEIDLENGKISWRSPLAKSLLGKQAGDECTFQKPKGSETIEILEIHYL